MAPNTGAKGQAGDLQTRNGAPAPAITPDPDLWHRSVWAGGYGAAQFNGADAGARTAATFLSLPGATFSVNGAAAHEPARHRGRQATIG